MGWQDAPLVEQPKQPKWMSAPTVEEATATTPELTDFRSQYAGQGLLQGNVNYLKDYLKGVGSAATRELSPEARASMAGPVGTTAALGDAALHLGTSAVAPLLALPDWAITKAGLPDPRNPAGTYAGAREKYIFEPRTEGGQAIADLGKAALKPVGDAFSLVGSGYGDIAKLGGASTETQKEIRDIAPDVVSAGLAVGAMRAPKPGKAPVPTKEQLAEQSRAAYKRAEDAGIAVSGQSYEAMKMRLLDRLEKEGIDKDLHPDASAALRRIGSEQGPITLEKLETLRRVAKDAEASTKPADARKAGQIVDELDEFVDALADKDLVSGKAADASALKQARALYTRKRKTDTIDKIISDAELSASGTQAGLISGFRALAKNERRMRMFTPEEQAAIRQVAKGGGLTEKALRLFGKTAPTGIVSSALGSGAGYVLGGPVGAAAVPAAGFASRALSTQMTKRNARLAEELMRRGPRQPPATPPQPVSKAPAAGLAAPESNEAAKRRELIAMLLRGY